MFNLSLDRMAEIVELSLEPIPYWGVDNDQETKRPEA
jgi:hypothetical protein